MKYFIKSSYVQLLKRQLKLVSVSVIYSMWEGYLDESNSNSYLPKLKKDTEINLISIHTSGHAVIDDLKRMVAAIKPKKLIPIHTEHGQKYDDYFSNVLHLKDGDSIQI